MIIRFDGYKSIYKGTEVDEAVGRAQKAITLDRDNVFTGTNTFEAPVYLGDEAEAITPDSSDNSSRVATTAFVKEQGFISDLTSEMITTALGFTPYSSSNPEGYEANVINTIKVNNVAQTVTSKTVNIAVPTKVSDLVNDSGFITGITSADVIAALDYTPENVGNKVTSLSASSTDTEYPSAKIVYTLINANSTAINTINGKIPSEATSSNQLADKAFVNSSIATSTADFVGTFDSLAELEAYTGPVTNNDYAFVIGTDSAGNTVYNRYKYTTATTPASWQFEYALNNSSFTATQWAAINSGITANDVTLLETALQPGDNISGLTNDAGYITGITSSDVTTALGFTPYNATNPDGYITGITSSDVTTALGYTPYNATNPNGYISGITSSDVTTALGYTPYDATNPDGYITGITSSDVTTALGFTPYNATNPDGFISGITSSDVTTALGFTPYDATNPDGFISGITSSDVTSALGYTPYNGATNPNGYISSASISSLTDVTLSSLANGQALLYNPTSGKWENKNVLTSVSWGEITGTLSNQIDLQNALDAKTTMAAVEAKGYITGIDSTDVVTALGYTPYDGVTNPNGYIVGISGSDVIEALGYTPENVTNKVTSLSASSTDTQYPSAKCVYDSIQASTITTLSGLTDVSISSAANNQGLLYNSTSGKWENKNVLTSVSWGEIGGVLADQTDLQSALDSKTTMAAVEAKGYITGITGSDVVSALGYTPYDASNPNGYIIGISSSDVITALGYTPYNGATNPNGYISGISSSDVTTALGYTPYNSTNPDGYISEITSSMVTTALGYTPYDSTNPDGYITGISSSDVITALGFTPASENALTSGLASKQDTLVSGTNIKTINSTSLLGSGDIAVQPVISSNNKLSSDLVDDTNKTHKFATATQLTQISTNQTDISIINEKIPSEASSSNQLADKAFVNSSIATNTANFIGTFSNVSELESYTGTITNNDYAFVINSVVTNSGSDWATFSALNAYNKDLLTNFDYAWVVNGSNFDLYRFDIVNQQWDLKVSNTAKADVTLNTAYNRYKATVSGSTVTWEYEYTLNNSSFTAAQWAAINSGITSSDVALIGTALQPNDNISSLTNDSGYITGITSTDVTSALGFTPYNATNPSGYISSASMAALTDASISSPSNGQILVYDGTSAKWKNQNAPATATWGNITGTLSNQTDLQTALNGKQPTITGAASTVTSSDLTTGRVVISNSSGKIDVSSITSTKLGYLNDVTSNIQAQINGKQDTISGLDTIIAGAEAGATALQPNDNISSLTNDSGYITGITSSDVTTALGYTPYNSSNPAGYTTNIGTVTSVNGTQPDASGNVSLSISTSLSGLTDVSLSSPTQGQNLTYDATTGKWKNTSTSATIAWGGITGTLSDQTDLQSALDAKTTMAAVEAKGYITGITSSDVTTALGYTPANSSDLASYVTTSTDQDITGTKTFVGSKKIAFKQSGTNDKLGFTLYNNSGLEKGYLEFNPTNTIDGAPLMTLGNYASSASSITHVGFRKFSNVSGANGAYNLLTPLVADARTPFNLTTTYKNFYLPLGITDGTTTLTTAKTGLLDISSFLSGFLTGITSSDVTTALGYTPYNGATNPNGYITGITSSDVTTALGYTPVNPSSLATVATSGDYDDLIDKPIIPTATSDLTNDSGYITGISSSDVTTALGYTPYSSSNPDGYISGITSSMVTTALGYTPYNSSNPDGYISGITSNMVTTALGFTPYDSSNPDGYITGITSSDVTTALGFTPYDSSNPDGYITGITSSDVTTALGYTPVNPSSLATVATTGDYDDLINKPSTPNPNPAYGTSSTAAATAEKVVSIPAITSLEVGQVLYIRPSTTSTVANSTIKLNDFDPYPMRYNNAAITTSTDSIVWGASFVSIFVFDGTYWQFAGHGIDSNTTYSGMTISEGTTGTATTTRVLTAANLKGIIQGTKLTGLSTSDSSDVVATDTVLGGIGKLQAQINASKILINITYADLVTLKTNEELYEGAFYRIVDYVTTCNGYTPRTSPNEPSRSVGHQFDIIIQALSTSTLADKGTASIHEGDTYFANSNLGGWTVYYDIENDTNKYKWADTTNGKGVIYRLIDENNNDLPFDFKNIQFYRDSANYSSISTYLTASDGYYYAFSLNTSGTITDYSIDGGSYCINNQFKALGVGQGTGLFNSVWVVNATAMEVSNNDIGSNSYNNTCCGTFQRNHISKGSMINNIINDTCRNNTIGAHFRDNIIGTTFENNTAGNYFSYNTLGNTFSYNTIGENVNNITTGTTFKYCSLGNYCSYLTFGNSIQTDVFENYVRYMTIPASLLNLRVEKYTVGTAAAPLNLTGLPTGAKYSITLRRDVNAGFLATWNDGITIYGKYKATSGTANWTDVNNKQVQSDWNQTDSTAVDFIKNKPNIPSGVIVDQTYDGTSTNAQSGVAIEGAGFVKNTATGIGDLTINGTATQSNRSINIGTSSSATAGYCVALGYEAEASGTGATAIGDTAKATANRTIQIGQGTNSTASSLQVGFGTSATNYTLLDGTTGLIPDARVSSNIARTSQIPDTSNLADKDLSNLSSTGEAKFQAPLVSGTNIKTVNNTSILGSGNIDTSDVFVAEFWVTSYSDITTEIIAGKTIFCSVGSHGVSAEQGNLAPLMRGSAGVLYFSCVRDNIVYTYECRSTGWTAIKNTLQKANLVTSISSSSTDTQYPSAKCVYDTVSGVQTLQPIATTSASITLTDADSLYKLTPSSATAVSFTNNTSASASKAYTFELCVDMSSTVYAITFPNSVAWQEGEIPDLSSTGIYFFAFRTIDGGTTWLGNLQGRW